jgi:kumamolisin
MGRVEIPGSAPTHTQSASRTPIAPGEELSVSVILMRPDPAAIAAVENFAKTYELQATEASAEKRTVKLAGTAAQFERAFGVQLGTFGNYISYAGPLTVPDTLADKVLAVLGLDNRPIARRE